MDPNYVAFVEHQSNVLTILDLRNTAQPIVLKRHTDCLNGLQWSPQQANIILTTAEDGQCYLWDTASPKGPKPTMGYDCKEPVAACGWSSLNKEWCSAAHDKVIEILHI